ncbi:undecaprenyl-phosphate mannosyltransferase [bacterium BMS3Abin10]|nr:undecaprenyl-phosphate mannosyltransferase [bacterium BMS3Abin10]GBE37664.1 undecaprenyl-phosphate mannosyltransferase [bacterium BMS3Bbin08]HDH50017.1 glycosyltransferase family 2 protein [Nitrospirota bacterium]HDK17376.1 glycosyltransferase family 2 protein [Nitrospirota bacterium]
MRSNKNISVIIPALNEEASLPRTLRDIPRDLVDEVVVVDNGSTDSTPSIAREWGATVLFEPRRGYGYPCLKGIEYLKDRNPDVVVFLDGNYSDHPEEIIRLVDPVVKEGYDLVLGSRVMGKCEKGALRPPVRFGNFLASALIRLLYGFKYSDMGPFRAIRFDKLLELDMKGNLGWTIEMQVKAIKKGYSITEVPVSYRKGSGRSKITGNVKGILKVGYRIIRTIFKLRFSK